MINTIKNWAIIADFVLSAVAFGIKKSEPKLSDNLFTVTAIALAVAFVCVLIDMTKKKGK
jgi:hypothetical protein